MAQLRGDYGQQIAERKDGGHHATRRSIMRGPRRPFVEEPGRLRMGEDHLVLREASSCKGRRVVIVGFGGSMDAYERG